MSSAQSTGAAISARQINNLIKSTTARFTGKARGRDRQVRRNSYDVDDARAQPWSRVGDGSIAQGLAHRDALLQAAKEWYQKLWKEMPGRQVRTARERRAELSAELHQLLEGGAAPVGRPATLRQEIARLDELLDRARHRLRRIDLTVLEALIGRIDFATGRLFPALETIAEHAGCSRNAVIASLGRLKVHGFIAWVRRSVKTDNEGQFAPQREQTSNAYYFDHRQKMAPQVWQRFWQLLVARIRRIGAARPAEPPAKPVEERRVADSALRSALQGLESALLNAST